MKKLLVVLAICLFVVGTIGTANATTLTLELLTDNYANEISFELLDSTNAPLAPTPSVPSLTNATYYSFGWDLAPDVYQFTINDSFGDGICCDFGFGYYTLKLDSVPFHSGGNYDYSETTEFEVTSAPVPEPGTMLLLGIGLVGLVGFRKNFTK